MFPMPADIGAGRRGCQQHSAGAELAQSSEELAQGHTTAGVSPPSFSFTCRCKHSCTAMRLEHLLPGQEEQGDLQSSSSLY